MLYIMLVIFILMTLIIIYLLTRYRNEAEYNLMEDVPIIGVNKEGLEKHAEIIASEFTANKRANCRKKVMGSLDKSYDDIIKAYEYIDKDIRSKNDIVPAAEWMMDNLYLIEKEYKDIKLNMPRKYYTDLPIIDRGILKCYPRVYHIAVELVSHIDGRIDEEIVETFIKAYQRNSVLTSGELWALPIMIRIALIQNIAKTVQKVVFAQEEKKRGDIAAEKFINAFNGGDIKGEIEAFLHNEMELSPFYVEKFLKVLRDNGIECAEIFKAIDEKLKEQQTDTERMIAIEHKRQANFQVSMGNSINSIREISAINWRNAFENLSYVESVLKEDPSGVYENMDFESRDYYRHIIEKISKAVNLPEAFIANKAIECAKRVNPDENNNYTQHVGYYIIDNGINELKKEIGYKGRKLEKFSMGSAKNKVTAYISFIVTVTLLLSLIAVLISAQGRAAVPIWRLVVAFIAVLIPFSEIVVSILNWSINHITSPRIVPKLEFKDGIPEKFSSVVVIPTLLNDVNRVHNLINDMEIYYLANQEKNLFFALLGDFKDSTSEHEENDKAIIEAALEDIEALNNKYCKKGEEIFYFFNRYRQFNKKENKWLGWERKRGKLMEFNALLRGSKDTSYNVISGDISKLMKIKYVITLDADTQLPRDSAKRLIGAMAHTLNRPYIDYDRKRVARGYGLMQPRISVSTIAANKTMFSKIFSGETGIDMYTTAISDVYQDMFGEGIFTGKGIFDIDVFEYMLKDEIPENSVLSHDLLEGSYVRTALVTDIELIDGYPAFYNSSSMRLHRWVRGDWQLLPWLLKKNPLNKLSKWKIFDNLRRSLLAPSIMILIALAVSILPLGEQWIIIAFLAILSPILFDVSEAVVSPMKGIGLSGKIINVKMAVMQVFLIFCFLSYQGYLMVDAIIRTIYRVFVSRKNLLEWQTAADVELKLGKKLKNFIAAMWPGSLIAALITWLAFQSSVDLGIVILPSCIFWFISPYLAYYISLERKRQNIEISETDKQMLRRISRKTWSYFEDFVNSENNWLAPDNYQQDPPNGVAPRTSPTNMGMGLTSNLAAYDLGYIGVISVVERVDKITSSMEELQRYKGHFYNWYDTKTKEPLLPKYISTVDSGNLIGYLWLTIEALNEYIRYPVISDKMYLGLRDTVELCNDELKGEIDLIGYYNSLTNEKKRSDFDIVIWKKNLVDLWGKIIEVNKEDNNEAYWNSKLKHSVSRALREQQRVFPWADIIIDTPAQLEDIGKKLNNIPVDVPLYKIPDELKSVENTIEYKISKEKLDSSDLEWLEQLKSLVGSGRKEIEKLLDRIKGLIQRLSDMAEATDFSMLYDCRRQLFSIGYDVERDSLGNSYYDLLASESRQASFVAIAKGDIEQKHWFRLSRAMTVMGRSKGLVSWSGTMFEYFMPLLIMRNYPDTLLNETYNSVVEGQKKYGRDRRVPWGVSESAYHTFDTALNYQYKAFGVPGIGLKRGLANELVISPYSTVMASMIDIKGALENMSRLMDEGLEGRYGFYEAIDYTKERMPRGKKKAIVKCFMVHHEGMSLMALDNVLNSNVLQERFHRIPLVKATELLLQEKVPKGVVYDREQKFDVTDAINEKQSMVVRAYNTAKTQMPQTHLLSNGSYSVMISNSGSGYSKKGDITIYRWREDPTLDNTGMFFYIKNLNSNDYWSATYEPVRDEGEEYNVIFSLDKAEFKRRDGNISTNTEVTVSNEDNAEVRRISITNHSDHFRMVEVTSYCEVTLAEYNADIVHPTFSNLFIETEFIGELGCVISSRRPRAKDKKRLFAMQITAVEGESVGGIQYETSRINFLGRGRDVSDPLVMENDTPLKNTTGAVLDPIISIRRRVKIAPGQTCRISYTTAICESKQEAIDLGRKYKEVQNINRVFELAWTQSQVEMRYLGIKSNQANLYQLMASRVLFINSLMKEREKYIKNIRKSQPALWAYGISGDIPILLLIIRGEKDIDLVRQILSAHEYWSIKGLKVDVVILNMENTVYVQPLMDSVRDLISSSHARDKQNKPGGVFLHSKATIAKDDIELLMAISRLVIDSEKGSLINQIKEREEKEIELEALDTRELLFDEKEKILKVKDLEFFNGFGGFDLNENKYTIVLKDKRNTPAPWINVISNKEFGFHVSESGSSYTWYKNSRENKLTPWSNDPITDPATEALYLRDEITGSVWSISPKPIRDDGEYVIHHGFGYSSFVHEAYGIYGEMTMFAPMDENVKLCIVKVKNNSSIERSLSLTYYAQLTIGVVPQQTSQYVSTYINEKRKFIYGRNPYSEHFGNANVYLKISGGKEESFTGDRSQFLGRGESLEEPKALKAKKFLNTTGSGVDPCLASNTKLSLKPDEEKILIVMLGANESLLDIERLIDKYSEVSEAVNKLEEVKEYWSKLLGTIKVKTPDKTMDIMLNGWLMYQTIACRYWARSAFYQSGGAMGFRDQLQDSMAIGYLDSIFTKDQILRSASRQFEEGDVQHWWHPVVNSGIRTRFSDDLLWLPYVTSDYLKITGDYSILDEQVGYLKDEPLKEGEDERYKISGPSDNTGSIYEHCVKTIDLSLRFGSHNIPLMGSGDWNDGMSTVGNQGRGESVWLGWFLYDILDDFKDICRIKGDEDRYKKYLEMRDFLGENLEKNAWDGGWYRRAYFDDGTPLGSIENSECQIDSLAQSWSVISGAAKRSRAEEAMEALEKYLVKEDKGMVLLLTPAFDNSDLEPGYIKGYVAGVRENGGQYTHAATWVILAFAKLGYGHKAWNIYHMINPINHAKSHLDCERYKVEPYVMAADVYAKEPHEGRGGWTWYTGAAGWMYRVGVEGILGLKLREGKGFTIEPSIPDEWPGYELSYRRNEAMYDIQVKRGMEKGTFMNGELIQDGIIPLADSGNYKVEVVI